MKRFAVYFVPPPQSPLAAAANRWFGDHPGAAAADTQKRRLAPQRYRCILAGPRHYGFHATIQPPFHPAKGVSQELISSALEHLCCRHQPFLLPPLVITFMHTFFCLRPAATTPELSALAAETVQTLLVLRQPPDEAEKEKRRAANLSSRQEKILQKWGYPYLMEEYRFHLSLTGKIDDEGEIPALLQDLKEIFAAAAQEQMHFAELCLCVEENGAPLRLLRRFPLGQAGADLWSPRCKSRQHPVSKCGDGEEGKTEKRIIES